MNDGTLAVPHRSKDSDTCNKENINQSTRVTGGYVRTLTRTILGNITSSRKPVDPPVFHTEG